MEIFQETNIPEEHQPTTVTVGPASTADTAAVVALLRSCELPADDIADHLDEVLVARDGDEIVATIGLEPFGDVGLLRSLAVAPRWRGRGLGDGLCHRLEERAVVLGLRRLYLLTTTASAYFARRGWREVERDRVPAAIRATREFSSLCPASAVVMFRDLQEEE